MLFDKYHASLAVNGFARSALASLRAGVNAH